MAPSYEVLPGLPGEGPRPEQFTTRGGTHCEGFVVRVIPDRGSAWVGNFQPGRGGISRVLLHPDGRMLVVLSGGAAYPVDPESRRLALPAVDDAIQEFCVFEDHILLAGCTQLTLLGPAGRCWHSPHVAWGGIEGLRIEGATLFAREWDDVQEAWRPVTIDLRDGPGPDPAIGEPVGTGRYPSPWSAVQSLVRRLLGLRGD